MRQDIQWAQAGYQGCHLQQQRAVNIFTKVDNQLVVDGVKTDNVLMVIFGHKDQLKDKEIKNFHNFQLQEALQFVLSDIVKSKDSVLYAFAELADAIDIDQLGLMKRKGIKMSYLAKSEVLLAFEKKTEKKLK